MSVESIFYLVVGLVGVFVVLLGYRLFQVAITLIGAIGGAVYGFRIVELAFAPEGLWIPVAAAVVGLLVGVGAALAVYYLGIFAGGAYLGFWLGSSFAEGFELPYPVLMVGGFAALIGLLAMVLERWCLIVVTAAVGAWHVAASTAYFTEGVHLLPYAHPFSDGQEWLESVDAQALIIAGGCFLLGFFIQKLMTAKRKIS